MTTKSRVIAIAIAALVLLTLAPNVLWAQTTTVDDPIMAICASWSYLNASYCNVATPALDIGTTASSNPTFNIGMNDGQSTQNVLLVALVPTASTTAVSSMSFSATFTQNGSFHTLNNVTAHAAPPFVSNQELLTYLGLTCNANWPGGSCSGNDYHFNSINALQTVAGTHGYSVYLMSAGFGTVGPANHTLSGPQIIGVSFSNISGGGFAAGTIFLALGVNNGQVVFKTPLTLAEETLNGPPPPVTTPEPVSLSLFTLGLAGMGALRKHRGKLV